MDIHELRQYVRETGSRVKAGNAKRIGCIPRSILEKGSTFNMNVPESKVKGFVIETRLSPTVIRRRTIN